MNSIGDHFHGTYYIITLKDGNKVKLWFVGSQLKKLLESYNIPYELKENK